MKNLNLNIDYIMLLGMLLTITSLFYFLHYLIKTIKDRKKFNAKLIHRNIMMYKKLDKVISKIKVLNWLKEELQLKYGVINSSTENQNKNRAIKTILNMSILSVILSLLILPIIKIWYLILPITISIFIFPYIILFIVLNTKLVKLQNQFAEALNIFITKYTSDKSKDRALQRTYPELSYPMRYEIMRLSRSMANKSNVIESVKDFSKRVNYIWAEVFGELLIMNHNTVDDIGDELNELSIIMLEDQSIEADKQAEINGEKNVNVFVGFCVVGAILINLIVFKNEAINIYFQRYIGIVGISLSVVVTIFCVSLTYYFAKS